MASGQSAPGLVQAYDKYRARGVAFVSLTADPRDQAASFVKRFSVTWPCGYEAPLGEIARWGAYSASRWSQNYAPGYEVTPTLFLLAPDGRVLWCDGQMRPLHIGDTKELLRRLDDALQAALETATGPEKSP